MLGLSDLNLTEGKRQGIAEITECLRAHGLTLSIDRASESSNRSFDVSPQTSEYLKFAANIIKRVEISVPLNQMNSADRSNKILLFIILNIYSAKI